MKIKDFNAVFGPIMHVKGFCLYFDKTGITDFEIILKKYFQRKSGLIFFYSNRKMHQNLWEDSDSSIFHPFLPLRLAILAVPFKDKDKDSQSIPVIAANCFL